MTTTLPDPATGTSAGTPAGRASGPVDLNAMADRLAAMPRSWTPSISELLEQEGRSGRGGRGTGGHDSEPARPAPSERPSLADLDRVLDELAANDAEIATLHAHRAVLLARAAGLAEALESDLVADDDPTARRAPSARRLELARRAVTTEIATTLHLGEHATDTLTDHALTLTSKAPATLAALSAGRLSWAHATAITKHVADLTPEEAAAVEHAVLTTVLDHDTGTQTAPPRARPPRSHAGHAGPARPPTPPR